MINTDISEIFLSSTILKRNKLSFADATVQAINTWASSLSLMQLGDTSESILKAVYEISELNCSETLRFDLIQVLHPFIENVLSSLERHFLNQGLSPTDRNEHIIILTTHLRIYFTNIYINIAHRSHHQLIHQKFSIFNFSHRKNLKTARVLATYYALEQLGLLLVQQQMLYSNALPHQWFSTHHLFELANNNQEQLININHLQGSNHPIPNIIQMYSQILLLDIFNTHQIRPSEILALYQCSFDWAEMIEISNKESAISRYVLDSSKDHPPIYNKKIHEKFLPNLYISTQTLLEHINTTIQKDSEYLSKNEKSHLSTSLKFHVQNVLGTSSERQHERYEHSAHIQVCFSLLTAHFHLSQAKNFYETLQLKNNFDIQTESKLLSSFANQNLDSDSNTKILDREAKKIYQVQVLDISLTGYRMSWVDETPKNLRTGEFILVSEILQNKWKGALIRWIKQSTNKTYEIGVEILAQEIYPCAIKTITDRTNINYHPCLILQNQNLDEINTSLILPNLPIFKEQQAIHMQFADHEIKVFLNKTLLITQSFIQFDFELLNEEHKILIDQFIQQQATDLNNQDVWEALK